MKGTVPDNDPSVSTPEILQSEINDVDSSQQVTVASSSKVYTSAACLGLALASGMLFPDQSNATTEPSVAAPTPVMHPSLDSNNSAHAASEPWQPALLRDVSEMNRNSGFPNQAAGDQKQADKALEDHLAESVSEPTVSSELFPQSSTATHNTFQPNPNPTGSDHVEISRPSSFGSANVFESEAVYPTPQTVYTQPKQDQAKFSGTSKVPGAVVIESDLSATPVSLVYNVTLGDTLAQIANRHHVSVEALIETNRLNDPNYIEVNQRLKIPHKSALGQGSKFEGSPVIAEIPAMGRQSTHASTQAGSSLSSPLFNRSVTPSVIPAEVKVPLVRKPLAVQLGTSVLSQMAAETGDRGNIALSGLALGQFNKEGFSPKPLTTPLLSAPIVSDDRNWEGSQPTASRQPEELSLSDSKDLGALETTHSTKVYTDRLRAEVDRLRAEYRAQQSYQLVNASWEPVADPTVAQTPTMVQLADRLRRTNPEFSPQADLKPNSEALAPDPLPSQQLAQQAQASELQASELIVDQLQQASESNDLVATAPLGSSAYDPLKNPAIGRIVSPELPPLLGPDAYLPGGSMRFNGYSWPSQGILTSRYGWRWGRMHRGIDIAGPIGTPIVAAAPGVVSHAGWNSGGYGNLVEIEHPDGSLTLYAHNNRILVNKGQKVSQGQQISEMGSTGRSTGPHLHFEIHPNGNGAVNPMALLPQGRSNLSQY